MTNLSPNDFAVQAENSLENFITILYDFKKYSAKVVLLERPQQLEMKLLEMGKDMKLKHSVSSWGDFFLKRALHREQTFLGKFMAASFT